MRIGFQRPFSPHSHDQEARQLLAGILEGYIYSNNHDHLSTIKSRLDKIIVELQDGDITKNLQSFLGSSAFEITLQLLRYSVHLSSNNLLSNYHTNQLLKLIVQSGHFAAVENLIKLKTSTTEIFASNILLSAVRIGYIPTIQALIALGIDVNIPGGHHKKDMALLVAVKEAISQRISGEKEDFFLVMILLNAGADINTKSGYNIISLLREVISEKHVQLLQILLEAGPIPNVPADKTYFFYNAMINAVRDGGFELAKKLLDVLAQPSMITLLQNAAAVSNLDDTDIIGNILDLGVDVDAPVGVIYEVARKAAVESDNWQHLQSAIQIAASNGHTEIVQVLLEAGASVDGYSFTQEEFSTYESVFCRDLEERYRNREEYCYDGWDDDEIKDDSSACSDEDSIFLSHFYQTPLQSAVEWGNEVLVRILLLAGADIEGKDRGLTPLQLAAARGEVKLVWLMLKKGAAIHAPARGIRGRTALQAAVESGSTSLVDILMDAGSDINAAASPNSGCTVLQAAVKINNVHLVKKLIALGADVNAAPSPISGRTCLQQAARKGYLELVQILLRSGADVNAAGAAEYGFTALQIAARGDHLSVVKVLLAAGANVHAPATERGRSAISAAVMRNSLEMVQLFLEVADIHGDTDPLPPLFRASRMGATEIVQCLIQAGANTNALRTDKPSSGYDYPYTAFEVALREGHFGVFEMLLDAGVDFNGEVIDLKAALGAAIAIEDKNRELIQSSFSHKLLKVRVGINKILPDYEIPLFNAVSCSDQHLVQTLLDEGADANGRTPRRNTVFQTAVKKGNIDLIELLLNAGADMEAYSPTDAPRTALQYAAQRGNTVVVRFLLERGANCNAPAADLMGATALQAAAIGGNLQITLMLLKAGANINAPAARIHGRSALEAAAEHGRLDILSLFLKNDTDTDGLESRCRDAAMLAEREGHVYISRMLRAYRSVGSGAPGV